MQLRAATKPTDANFVRVIRNKVQSIKVVTNDSIGACSLVDYVLYLFETSGADSCGTTGMITCQIFACFGTMENGRFVDSEHGGPSKKISSETTEKIGSSAMPPATSCTAPAACCGSGMVTDA